MKEFVGKVELNYDFFDYDAVDPYNKAEFRTLLTCLKNGESMESILYGQKNWKYYYHLNPARAHLSELFQIKKTDSVLEIGSEAGALSGTIAQKCHSLDCVGRSEIQHHINAVRHAEENNIRIYVGPLERICFTKTYDVITLIGTLEHAPLYITAPSPYLGLLSLANSLLNPDGLLYVAVNNRFGLRYLSGYYDEHTHQPFGGITGGNPSKGTTFSQKELSHLLREAGFEQQYFYYPFPDYCFSNVVYSDDYFPRIQNYMNVSTNYINNRIVCFDENAVYPTLQDVEERKFLANSFLVEAKKGTVVR